MLGSPQFSARPPPDRYATYVGYKGGAFVFASGHLGTGSAPDLDSICHLDAFDADAAAIAEGCTDFADVTQGVSISC